MTSPSLFPSPDPYRRRRCAKLYNTYVHIPTICRQTFRVNLLNRSAAPGFPAVCPATLHGEAQIGGAILDPASDLGEPKQVAVVSGDLLKCQVKNCIYHIYLSYLSNLSITSIYFIYLSYLSIYVLSI